MTPLALGSVPFRASFDYAITFTLDSSQAASSVLLTLKTLRSGFVNIYTFAFPALTVSDLCLGHVGSFGTSEDRQKEGRTEVHSKRVEVHDQQTSEKNQFKSDPQFFFIGHLKYNYISDEVTRQVSEKCIKCLLSKYLNTQTTFSSRQNSRKKKRSICFEHASTLTPHNSHSHHSTTTHSNHPGPCRQMRQADQLVKIFPYY